MMRKTAPPIAAAAAAVILAFAFVFMNSPTGRGEEKAGFVVEQGDRLEEVAERLEREGYVRSKYFFYALVRASGKARSIKAGEYRLGGAMTSRGVVGTLSRGAVVTVRYTVPEGLNIGQVAAILEENGIVQAEGFVRSCSDRKLLKKYGIPFETAEGFLFPDTYVVAKGLSAFQIADIMVGKFFEKLEEVRFSGYTEKRLKEVVIVASLVEREAKIDSERPLVAAVFYNRLREGKRLESCATVQYALGKPKERLFFSDLKVESPYNTYLHKGLPPGPIASPGVRSLEAAVRPAEVDFLFFVSKTDGSHHFSSDYEEHQRAIRRYNPGGKVGHQVS